ncbi:MAG TPA: MaoC family dehydratase [Pseudonocardia sp.]|uniref:MaoC family dehydratase n=1 Tax=Pseudonocardia sp. TaxID=60912 RepID=UPI002B8A68A0|nr:MaoC family dehydratase [Pseudonocardia sp.]HTF51099.1 MaoC family dehydratase [Pseudonocardia sp.]
MRVFNGADELKAAVGEQLGASDWVTVDQKQIDTFAEATGDHQWIHVDTEKAKSGPFGTTIAHGYLTLSLLPVFSAQIYKIENVKMGINYGLNKVRFTSPVPVNSRLRGSFELLEVSEVQGGVQVVNKVTVEIDGNERPACVAEWVTRAYL